MPPKSVHFLRHAESMANIGIKDEYNSSLSSKGIDQAMSIKIDEDFDYVICSGLKRAQQTFTLGNIKHRDVIHTNLCQERIFDKTDALSESKFKLETDSEYFERLNRFYRMLHSLDGKVLIIAHNYFFGSIRYNCEHGKIEPLNLNNAEHKRIY